MLFIESSRWRLLCGITLLLSLLHSKATIAADLEFFGIKGSDTLETSNTVLKRAYAELGLSFTVRTMPAMRALEYSNMGRSDGELHRIAGLSKRYPNLIQVPTAINKFEAVVLSTDSDIEVNGWKSLQAYRIGIVRGIKFTEVGTRGMNTYTVDNYDQLFGILKKGKVDLIILARTTATKFQKTLGAEVSIIEPPVASYNLYHYLHKKNHTLVQPLDMALKDMQLKGEIVEARKAFLKAQAAQ
ncbi:MAG: hypothetical protein ACPG4U_00030 [Pseudomonadales bacterium]